MLSTSQEFNKHDREPAKYIKQWRGTKPKTGAPYSCDIGYERFLGPEVCFIYYVDLYLFYNIYSLISMLRREKLILIYRNSCNLNHTKIANGIQW